MLIVVYRVYRCVMVSRTVTYGLHCGMKELIKGVKLEGEIGI